MGSRREEKTREQEHPGPELEGPDDEGEVGQ